MQIAFSREFKIKTTLFFFSTFLFILIISIFFFFDLNNVGFQFYTSLYYFDTLVLLGLDSITICFLILTTFMIPLCLLFNWDIKSSFEELKLFVTVFLLLEILLLLVFTVLDLFAFYIVFEFILIPFYIITVLNKLMHYSRNSEVDNRKMHAFFLLFFYTIAGSLVLLLSITLIYVVSGTSMIPLLWYYTFDNTLEHLL